MDTIRADELKQKLRQLKRFEERVRFGGEAQPAGRLVWDRFFDTRQAPKGNARYSLEALSSMNKKAYKAAVDAFFACVYYEMYKESGMVFPGDRYDPALLHKLELPQDAPARDVRRRFRELALEYHPDTGGDTAKFIELMDTYRQLTGGK